MLGFRSIAALVALAAPLAAAAEIVESTDSGFVVRSEVVVADRSQKAYRALTESIGSWWDPAHTFSGDARNLSLEPRPGGCFCERLPDGGGVQHQTVSYVAPGKEIRLSGAVGPLQESGLAGSMTWRFSETADGTKVELTYSVGGYRRGGLRAIAGPVDTVLRAQLLRLKSYVETGRPQ